LKAQLDDLTAENLGLKAKADGLADEVARLKSKSSKAQELAKTRRLEAESRDKDMHRCLQTSLDVLRSESSISFDCTFSRQLSSLLTGEFVPS
jgi:hypothetical protein